MGKVTTSEALDLKVNHGLNYHQIGKLQGTSHVAIMKKIKHLLPNETTKVYQEKKADILDHAQLRLLSQVTDAKLKKVSVRDAVVSYGILYDKARLERGQATSIVDPGQATLDLAELSKRKDKLLDELKTIDVTPKP